MDTPLNVTVSQRRWSGLLADTSAIPILKICAGVVLDSRSLRTTESRDGSGGRATVGEYFLAVPAGQRVADIVQTRNGLQALWTERAHQAEALVNVVLLVGGEAMVQAAEGGGEGGIAHAAVKVDEQSFAQRVVAEAAVGEFGEFIVRIVSAQVLDGAVVRARVKAGSC